MRALSEHLVTCASCRQVEAAYRRVGESLRLLPTITPDASFKERVYAAIAAEERRMGPAAIRASRAETEPSLPVVRAPVHAPRSRRMARPVPIVAFVAAAALLLALFATQVIPGLRPGGLAASISGGATSTVVDSHITHYAIDQRYNQATEVRVNQNWLAYTAVDANGVSQLFVMDRATGASHALLAGLASGSVTIVSLSNHWIVWSVTSATGMGWRVYATALGGVWQTHIVNASELSTLTGAWADDSQALIATSAGAQSQLVSMPIATTSTQGTLIATGARQGSVITSPSIADGVTYWSDVWADTQNNLHSAVWTLTPTGPSPIAQAGGQAYGPVGVNGRLVWISATRVVSVDSPTAAAIAAATPKATGALRVMSLNNSSVQSLASQAVASSVRVTADDVVWSDGSKMHGYDFTVAAALPVADQFASAKVADVSGNAVAWFDGSRFSVYALA